MAAPTACFRATFTRDGHKKPRNRRWLDGFVTQSGREAKLYDEGGAVVAVARLAPGEELEEGAELDKGFGQGVVVAVDTPCSPAEINGEPAVAVPAAVAPTQAAAPTAAVPHAAARPAVRSAGAVPKLAGAGRRAIFQAPRAVPVATGPAEATALPAVPGAAKASAGPPTQQRQPRQFEPPARRAFAPPPAGMGQPGSAMVAAAPAAAALLAVGAVRSDADILRLLTGQAQLHDAPAPAPAEAAAPAAKRPRLELPGGAPQPGPAAAATTALPVSFAAAKPRWSGFMDEEDADEQSGGIWAEGALAAAHAAAAQHPDGGAASAPAVRLQRWGQQPPAWQPGAAAKPAEIGERPERQRATWAAAPAAGTGDAAELDLSPGGTADIAGTAGGFRPIVRPQHAAELAAAHQQLAAAGSERGWTGRGQQPTPLPTRQPLQAQQPAARPGLGPAAGPGNGAWKAPASVARAAVAAAASGAARRLVPSAPAAAPAAAAAGSGWNRLVGGVVQLGWPTAEEAARPLRRVAIPDSFSSSQQYVQAWSNALLEELNLRIAEVAQSFHSAMAAHSAVQQQLPRPPYRPQGGRGAGGGGRGGGGAGGLEARLWQARVTYSSNCELFVWRNLPKKGGWNGKGKRGRQSQDEDEEDGGGEEDAAAKPDSLYLILKSGRQKSAEYRKDDLWIVSNNAEFRCGFAPGQLGDRSRVPWVAVARSLWHGPNQDGKFEIEFLSPRPPGLGRTTAVHAIKGPDASTELSMMDLLRSGALLSLPLLPHLLRARGAAGAGASAGAGCGPPRQRWQAGAPGSAAGPQAPAVEAAEPGSPCYSCSEEDADDDAVAAAAAAAEGLLESPLVQAARIIQRFQLNQEQGEVVQYVASWCTAGGGGTGGAGSASKARSGSDAAPPVCLVHGPFGSGKSTLLVALLHFLLEQRGRQGSPLAGARVLVSAHTNVAVDRVLIGLLESGCTDFLRVGPLRRLSRRLLRQSLHASESRATASAAAELREMLKEAGSPAELAAIQTELAAAEKGADRQRRRLLKTVPIVGVTCCSATLAALDGQHFDVVLLDECSQMVEPLSMVPLLRAKARFVIAAGDPLQLPPVVASPAHVTPARGERAGPAGQPQQLHGLLRPLFVRLAALGMPPFLLRRQYRCHPDISAIPNAQFYQGRLVDGCTREQRASLLPGLPSLAFLDVRGQEQYGAGRSASNQQEAEAVVEAVERLVAAGVSLGQCGVICFFRAQVALVRSLLDRRMAQLEAMQRRQRQHAALLGGRSSSGPEQPDLSGHLQAGGAGGGGGGSGGPGGAQEEEEEQEGGSEEAQHGIQVATVDSFQGAERDCIILTTAVTRPGAFASDSCRLNVALTRSRRNLILVGCAPALQKAAPAFAALLARCRSTPGGYSPNGRLPVTAAAAAPAGLLGPQAAGLGMAGHPAVAAGPAPAMWHGQGAAAVWRGVGFGDDGEDEEGWAAMEEASSGGHAQPAQQQPQGSASASKLLAPPSEQAPQAAAAAVPGTLHADQAGAAAEAAATAVGGLRCG